MIDGIPLYVFAPLLLGVGAVLYLLQNLMALTKQLGVSPQRDPENRLTKALYGGETYLRSNDIHGRVWTIRLMFVLEALCILAFAYLLLASGVAK